MKGSYQISVQNNLVKYEFTIRRNITVIQGNSATGKTTLVDLIREYQLNGADSGINLSCKKKCVVLEGNDWQQTLTLFQDCIVFIDEGNRFISSKDFASTIKQTDNYYVLITREGLENLPYSVNEIYGIHTSGKYADLKQIYHEFYHIYNDDFQGKPIGAVLTEDSNSGFDFFKNLSDGKYPCESAKGKSNIFNYLNKSEGTTLIVADGAAFGSQMDKVTKIIGRKNNAILYLPESFEYLILQSDLFKDAEISKVLKEPSGVIESKEYFSWEQFFTSLLIKVSKDTYLKYSKKKLNKNYLDESIKAKILNSDAFKAIKSFFEK